MIQRAIDKASSGDTILVTPGVYVEHIDFKGKSLHLRSTGGRNSTIIRGHNPDLPVISLTNGEDSTTAIQDLTIRAEYLTGESAIRCVGSSPAIVGNLVSGFGTRNNQPPGVSISGPGCTPIIRGNSFLNNVGSAIGGQGFDGATIDSNSFIGNNSYQGAVMNLANCFRLTIVGNIIDGNRASGGGTIWLDNVSNVWFDHNTVVHNACGANGALTLRDCSNVTLTNSIFAFDSGSCAIDWRGNGQPHARNNCIHGYAHGPYLGITRAEHTLYVDPDFCETAAAFSLAPESPCRGAGTEASNIGARSDVCNDPDTGEDLPTPNTFVAVQEMPVEIFHQVPVYPQQAREAGISGTVWIQSLVGEDGLVIDARVLKPSGQDHGFEEAAIRAAYGNRYRPAVQSGKPVAVWVSYKVDFRPDK